MRRLFVRPRAGTPFPRGLGWGPVSSPLAVRNPHPPGWPCSPSLTVPRRAPTASLGSGHALGLRLPLLRLGAAAGRVYVGSLRPPPFISWMLSSCGARGLRPHSPKGSSRRRERPTATRAESLFPAAREPCGHTRRVLYSAPRFARRLTCLASLGTSFF